MKKRTVLALILALAAVFDIAASAAPRDVDPVPVRFEKHGGGQFLYCNNPEFVSESDLSTDENPNPVYMMKQEGLTPGKYSVFFCFYNWTPFDVEPDIEFVSDDAEITINSVGYCIPQGWDYWDCLGAWADYTGENIRTIDGLAQYVPYSGIELPQTFSLKNSTEWINKYIYNYDAVSPKVTFNMLVDFTIEKGTADVNFAALKSYDKIGDRSHHVKNAPQSPYKNDTAIKGIEPETLPVVEAGLDVTITSKINDGQNVPVRVYNQYFPSGNTYDYWMTNINPSRDAYRYSKECSTGSDMLEFEFRDSSKLSYYGSGVPRTQRNSVWNFDIYHHNTTEYESGCPSRSELYHTPNAPLPDRLDINDPPDLDYEFNLGNFGVTNRYRLNVKNSDTISRSLNYYIDASYSSCLAAIRDADGNLLNPYTLEPEDAYIQSKGINYTKKTDYLFSVMLSPGEEREYIIDITLPTNCYGGIVNGLTVDDEPLMKPAEIIGLPEKSELYEYYYNTWFDGYETMRCDGGDIYAYRNNSWKKLDLPQKTRELFGGILKDIRLTKTKSGYIARFAGYDQYGGNIADTSDKRTLYVLDDKLNCIKSSELPTYISGAVYADGVTYIQSDKIYETQNGVTLFESKLSSLPVTNGRSVVEKRLDGWYIKENGKTEFTKINFEYPDVSEIRASDGVYYAVRSLKNYDTDFNTGNWLSVSTDGINYRDMTLPNSQFRFMRLDSVGGTLYAVGRNETYSRPKFDYEGGIKFLTPEGYLSLEYTLTEFDETTCADLDYLAGALGAEVYTSDMPNGEKRVSVSLDGREVSFITGGHAFYAGGDSLFAYTAPFYDGSTVYVPLMNFAKSLGFTVEYDEASQTVTIN